MFDCFKPPLFHIRKRLPDDALIEATAVEAYVLVRLADVSIPPFVERTNREYAAAFVVALWAGYAGALPLSERNDKFIYNIGWNAAKRLRTEVRQRTAIIINELREQGILPLQSRDGFALPTGEHLMFMVEGFSPRS